MEKNKATKTGKYNFDLLMTHSNSLALDSRRQLKTEIMSVKEAFAFLDKHFCFLEKQERAYLRNVKMAITARFINHLLSYVLLVERGLYLDAANCARSAVETTAFYWLVCLDASTCNLYDSESSPRPVEIRKKLEKMSVDVCDLQEAYKILSTVSHVGNATDNLQISWDKTNKNGQLLVGGGINIQRQKEMLKDVTKNILLFVRHDHDYEITASL